MIPDSFCIGSLFMLDIPSVQTMMLESDTLGIILRSQHDVRYIASKNAFCQKKS